MDWPRLDTRWWNLSLGVAATTAMSACGPTIILEGETDGVVTDSDGPETPPPDTTAPPVECESQSDCEPGFSCIDNACIPYDDYYYCQDGGCCYDECCYDYGGDCYYEGCYDDEQCGFAALCNDYGQCESVEVLPSCDELELTELPLPDEGDEEEIISLSFVDADGDGAEDLLVARPSRAQLIMGGGETSVDLPLAEEDDHVADAAGADFNGDGILDLAVTDATNSLSILIGDGAGGFEPGFTIATIDPVLELVALDWDGNGTSDLASRAASGSTVIHLGDGAGSLVAHVPLSGATHTLSYAAGRFDGDEHGDVVMLNDFEGVIYFGNDTEDVLPDQYLTSWNYENERRVVAGDVDGGGTSEIFAHGHVHSGWLLLEAWQNGGESLTQYALDRSAQRSDMGDYDGDGILDLILASSDYLSLVRGSPEIGSDAVVECHSYAETNIPVRMLAVGDLNGDGRADMAIADGSVLSVVTVVQ